MVITGGNVILPLESYRLAIKPLIFAHGIPRNAAIFVLSGRSLRRLIWEALCVVVPGK